MLCVRVDCMREMQQTDQLLICFANPVRGKALSKQHLPHWVVEAISHSYACENAQMPVRVHAHSARGRATSWALFKGVSVLYVCSAVSWSSPRTFMKFYCLDVKAQGVTQTVLSAGK